MENGNIPPNVSSIAARRKQKYGSGPRFRYHVTDDGRIELRLDVTGRHKWLRNAMRLVSRKSFWDFTYIGTLQCLYLGIQFGFFWESIGLWFDGENRRTEHIHEKKAYRNMLLAQHRPGMATVTPIRQRSTHKK